MTNWSSVQVRFVVVTIGAIAFLAAGLAVKAQDPAPAAAPRQLTPEEQTAMRRGGQIYRELCFTCHGPDGKGAPLPGGAAGASMGPPLAGSARLQGHPDYVLYVLLHGLVGPLEDKTYLSVMMPMGGNTDEWIAAVASFVRNGFGNTGSFVTAADVARARAATASRKTPWTFDELKAVIPPAAPETPK